MEIKVLGSGGAFSNKYKNTQLYINTGDPETSLLFDCGRTFFESAREVDMPLSDFRNIYISHTHSDHIGGLPDFALACYFYPELKKPSLFARRSITKVLWNNYLSIMLSTLANGQLPEGKNEATFHDYFNVNPVSNNGNFKLGNITYTPVQTIHVVNGYNFMDSYGLSFEAKGKKIFISGDSQFAPSQMEYVFNQSDIIIHDCETLPFKSGVHAHIEDLKQLSSEIKNKMYLIHYGDNIEDFRESIINSGFAGILRPNDTINI